MSGGRAFWWVPMAIAIVGGAGSAAADVEPFALSRLDLLPRFKNVKVGMVSSYDRTGGNDDGFSGRYSFIRKEGDGLVLADLKGPGMITRIWTPTPTQDPIEFYFDGETTPRLTVKFIELFDGTKEPFVAPLSGFGSGGFYTYVPLTYSKSCKVVARAQRIQFYQINFETYPSGSVVKSYNGAASLKDQHEIENARKLLSWTGADLNVSSGRHDRVVDTTKPTALKLLPGKASTVFQARKGGRLLGMRFSPASAFAGKDRSILLRITWDGDKEPAVLCPAGDFFGYAWGDPAARSLLIGTDGDTAYCYFPMPFEKSAKIELVDERTQGSEIALRAEIVTGSTPKQPDEGRFYALWRRENPTTIGKPFTFIETQGRGHLVGAILQSQGPESGHTYFFEGDDQCYIDGELAAHGTGSEDFFNGGWYDVPGRWEHRASYPLSGCLDYKKALGRTGGYRIMVSDAYTFQKELKLYIEHSGEKNDIVTDYSAVSFLYMENRPTMPIAVPPVAERRAKDFDRLVYVPGWNVPIYAFSFQNATLEKKDERIGDRGTRYLSFKATGNDVFGPHYIAFLAEIPVAGRYRVSAEAVEGPGQGIIQIFRDERAVGQPVDLYSAERKRGSLRLLGTVDMKEGDNALMLKLTGKNPASSGLGLDIVTLVFERE